METGGRTRVCGATWYGAEQKGAGARVRRRRMLSGRVRVRGPVQLEQGVSMAEFIYQMYQARKAHGDKVILDDVTLSFYPGQDRRRGSQRYGASRRLTQIMAGRKGGSLMARHASPPDTRWGCSSRLRSTTTRPSSENVRIAFSDLVPEGRALQPDRRGDGRARRGLRRAHGRDGPAAGRDRRRRRLGYRRQAQ